MRYLVMLAAFVAAFHFSTVTGWTHANYTGYSGAPGSRGTCSISCHNRSNFTPTITVTGFPSEYIPGQEYIIAVGHQGGSSISQFNASVRVGGGSTNAGVITAGASTSIYSVSPQETNGVHFSSSNQNSGTFNWTAPAAGTGLVRLYWAGLQGSLSNGADTAIVLTSAEAVTGIGDEAALPNIVTLSQNYPNPFNSETVIQFAVSEPGMVTLEINNVLGQRIFDWETDVPQAGQVSFRWDGKNSSGNDVPSGVYFYRLHTAQADLVRKMILLR